MAADRITDAPFVTRSEVLACNGMAATSHPLATQIALDLLKRGGSAIDAAIAANAALGLMEPTGSGIGGDLFAIVWDPASGKLHGYNGSGRSPAALTPEHFQQRGLHAVPPRGPLPVTVPGAVDGWFALHQRFGKLPVSEVLAPTIAYAEEGFPLTEVIAHEWRQSVPLLAPYPGFLEQFTRHGAAPAKGEIWTNRALADTLRRIASNGRNGFYGGETADAIDAYFRANDGYLRREDLADHQGQWVQPVSVDYRGHQVWELPPNGQGFTVLQMLKLLEGFDLSRLGYDHPDYVHLLIEAKKLAFADRARFYADPDFHRAPLSELLSNGYAAQRRALIDPDRAAVSVDPGNPALDAGDTVYLTTADRSGMMVSLIQSNFRGMGSGMAPPGLGFVFQNRGEQFVVTPMAFPRASDPSTPSFRPSSRATANPGSASG